MERLTKGNIGLLKPGMTVGSVVVQGVERDHTGKEVYFSRIGEAGAKLIVYPNDELIDLGQELAVVVNNISIKEDGTIVHCEVLHRLRIDDDLRVRLSGTSRESEFMFRLRGYLGFLKRWHDNVTGLYDTLQIGDYVLARVKSISLGDKLDKKGTRYDYVHAIPLEKLVVN